jgi:type VI secretion system protein ImpA
MKATKRKDFEAFHQPFEDSYENFLVLEKVVDEKFGDAAPSFALAKEMFQEMRGVLTPALKRKREEEPDAPAPGASGEEAAPKSAVPGVWFAGSSDGVSGSWQQAEALVRAGSVDLGLQQMAALAAQETSGRARFLRKLMLVDVCRNAGRERLARTILEELSNQITDFKLDRWESSALVGAVWSRLFRLYKNSEMSSEQDLAADLYKQLCQLDPWQAYKDCED